MKSLQIFAVISLGCMIHIFGCSTTPPKKVLMDAEKSLERAISAKAIIYAPEKYLEAKSNYKLALSQINIEEYEGAKISALAAGDKAELSRTLAVKREAFAKESAKRSIAKVESKFAINLKHAEKYTPKKLELIRSIIAETKWDFQNENYLLVEEKNAIVLDVIRDMSIFIEKAIEATKNQKKVISKKIKVKKRVAKKYPSQHIVTKGEKLWIIAKYKTIYDDPYLWPLIYKANRDQIKGPHHIYPGQILQIPRGLTPEEIMQARSQAKALEPLLVH